MTSNSRLSAMGQVLSDRIVGGDPDRLTRRRSSRGQPQSPARKIARENGSRLMRTNQTLAGWLSLPNTHTAEMMANAGFDWLCIDMQHGLLDYADLRHMLPAISTT